jgi:DNA-binding transcriptional LysR family regulator
MSLNLHHLRLFAAVADKGGFTRAAESLNLSQPAISKAIGDFERQLGTSLFDRGSRTLRLTDAGRILHARARELFGVEHAAAQQLRELRGLERGILRVGASTTIATYILPAILARFHAAHPRIRLKTISANTRSIAKLLLEWRVDVALVEGPVHHDRFDLVPWMEDELILIAPPDHPLVHRKSVPPAMLETERFIARERGSGTREVTERALAERGVRLRHLIQVGGGGTEAIKQAVAAGLGLAIVSRAAANDQLALGRIAVVPIDGLTIPRTLTQIKLRDRAPTAAASELAILLHGTGSKPGLADASGDPGWDPRARALES